MVSGLLHRFAVYQRRCACRLGAQHPGQLVDHTLVVILGVSLPVGGDVPRVADRKGMHVRRGAQHVDDFERRRLLALDAHRVDRVDQRDRREVGGHFAGEFQAVIEVAVNLDDLGAVHNRLRELAHRDLALRYQDRAGDAGARRVGRRRCRGVAGRGAQHGLLAARHRIGDRHRHAPVLERAGGVEALDLEDRPCSRSVRRAWPPGSAGYRPRAG